MWPVQYNSGLFTAARCGVGNKKPTHNVWRSSKNRLNKISHIQDVLYCRFELIFKSKTIMRNKFNSSFSCWVYSRNKQTRCTILNPNHERTSCNAYIIQQNFFISSNYSHVSQWFLLFALRQMKLPRSSLIDL